METETSSPRRIAGMTITCDRCDRRATYRSETKSAEHPGFDVHWTCGDHTEVAA